MIEHTSPISGIASFDQQFVATAGYDNQVVLWDAQLHVALARGCHDHLANQCEFSPNGELLASSSSDFTVRLWSIPDMRLRAVLIGHGDDVEGIAFHPEGNLVATASRDSTIIVFDLDGQVVRRLRGHTADVISVSWLNNGTELLSSSDDGTIRRWSLKTGALIETLDFEGVETDTIAISPDGTIFAGNDEGRLILIANGERTIIDAHNAGIKKVVYDQSTSRLVTLSYDRTARFWQYADLRVISLHEAALPPEIWPRSCAFLGSDKVAFVTFGTSYAIYDLQESSWDLSQVGPTWGVNSACMHDGSVFTVGDAGVIKRDGHIAYSVGSLCNFIISFERSLICGGQLGCVFDAAKGETIYQHRSPLNCAVVVPGDRPSLLIGTYTGEILLLEHGDDGIRHSKTLSLHDNAIKGLAASDANFFAVCATGAASIHNIGSWQAVRRDEIAHDKIANGCASLPDGRFASVSRDLKLRVWSKSGASIYQTPHRNSIKCCSASEGFIATGDYSGHVAIFDLRSSRFEKVTRLSAAGISSLTQNGQGGFLATSYDGNVYEIPLPSNQIVAE